MIPVGAKQTDLEQMDPRTLSAMVVGCLTHIERLELMIAQLRRMHFGRRSETAYSISHRYLVLWGAESENDL